MKNLTKRPKQSRTKEWFVYGLPLTLRIKPTRHKQNCHKCGEPMEKGQMQFKMRDGSWQRDIGESVYNNSRQGDYESYCRHVPHNATGVVYGGSYPHFTTPRYIYFHSDCFFCLMNKLVLESRAEIKTCEACPDRFKCFTDSDSIACTWKMPEKPRKFTKTNYVIDHNKDGHHTLRRKTDKEIEADKGRKSEPSKETCYQILEV